MEKRIPTLNEFVNEMLSDIPSKNSPASDEEILRTGILAEIDAINLYVQMANIAKDPKVKKALLDIAREEKTHIGEFQALLLEIDPEYKTEIENGAKEVKEF